MRRVGSGRVWSERERKRRGVVERVGEGERAEPKLKEKERKP